MVNVAPVNCGAQQYRRARPISLRLSACGTLSPGLGPATGAQSCCSFVRWSRRPSGTARIAPIRGGTEYRVRFPLFIRNF